jgi:endoglucanase
MKTSSLVGLLAVVFSFSQAMATEPFFVDLSPVANTSLQNDGTQGWANEGVNDMFTYPPFPTGEVTRNGYRFRIATPQNPTSKTVLMLKGQRLSDKPQEASAAVPNVKGRFVYFLQNSVGSVNGQPRNYRVATYTVRYADGSTAEIPVHDGVEIHRWWTGQWSENSGAKSWPFFMGRNAVGMKWNQLIGVWAMQWPNPSPDKPIASITFRSEGFVSPVIFAVTITDDDYFQSPHVKDDYQRPPDVPADYFQGKLAQEQGQLYQEMRKEQMVRGLRRVELIRSDLLAVTLDAAVAGGAGLTNDKAAALAAPSNFLVTGAGDANYAAGQSPTKVARLSSEYWNGDVGRFAQNVFYWHTYYLYLPKPLASGQSYDVQVKGLADDLTSRQPFNYDERRTITPVIKVNQVAYSSLAKRRYAYVGWWAGDAGPVDYSGLSRFQVVKEGDGEVALEGTLASRAKDELSGEDVWQIDLSPLPPGQYHIVVRGLGRSDSFAVGGRGIHDLYYDTSRAFYHQRCGHPLGEPHTTFTKAPCHTEVYESGHLVGGNYAPKPGEATRSFRGGYHDAADFDVFTYHLRATAQMLAAYAFAPERFKDRDLNIPESGNGIPDVLDEADWALFSYRDTQQPDGGVPLGRGNDEDAIRDWEREHNGTRPPFGLFPPTFSSSTEYAAVAAQFARLIRPYDAAKADQYLESARRAFACAQKQPDTGRPEMGGNLFLAWAAAELYSTTGDESFNDVVKRGWQAGWMKDVHWKLFPVAPTCLWPYIVSTQPGADRKIQQEMREVLLRRAHEIVKDTDAAPYRVGRGPHGEGNGWGNLNGGGHWADPCLRAYFLTRDAKYLDAACLNADFQLGANPLSKTFISGVGARPPLHPQISAFLYTGPNKTGSTVRGITIYGLTSDPPKWYPAIIPPWRRWRDLGNGSAEVSSEFTITETIGFSALLYGTLHALEP